MEPSKSCRACSSKNTRTMMLLDGIDILRCTNCKTVFIPKFETSLEVNSYHRAETAAAYNSYYDNLRRYQANQIIRMMKGCVPPPARLIDIGCGNGAFVKQAAVAGYISTGIDISLPPEEFQHAPGRLYKASVGDFASDANSFDVVSILNVLEHIREPESFLQTARKLCRPGGWLIFAIPLSTGLIYTLCRFLAVATSGLISGPWRTILQWHSPSPHVFLPSFRGLQEITNSVFGSKPSFVQPQKIVEPSFLRYRIQLEKLQREVGSIEEVLLFLGGYSFSTLSIIATRLHCPDEIFFAVKNEKTNS